MYRLGGLRLSHWPRELRIETYKFDGWRGQVFTVVLTARTAHSTVAGVTVLLPPEPLCHVFQDLVRLNLHRFHQILVDRYGKSSRMTRADAQFGWRCLELVKI